MAQETTFYACIRYLDDTLKYYYVPVKSIFYSKNDKKHIKPKDLNDFDSNHKYYVIWNNNQQNFNDDKLEKPIRYKGYIICLGESEEDSKNKALTKSKRFIFKKKLTTSETSEEEIDEEEVSNKPVKLKFCKSIVQKENAKRIITEYKQNTLLNSRKELRIEECSSDCDKTDTDRFSVKYKNRDVSVNLIDCVKSPGDALPKNQKARKSFSNAMSTSQPLPTPKTKQIIPKYSNLSQPQRFSHHSSLIKNSESINDLQFLKPSSDLEPSVNNSSPNSLRFLHQRSPSPTQCHSRSPNQDHSRPPNLNSSPSLNLRCSRSPNLRFSRSPNLRCSQSPNLRSRSPNLHCSKSQGLQCSRSSSLHHTRLPNLRSSRSPSLHRSQSPRLPQRNPLQVLQENEPNLNEPVLQRIQFPQQEIDNDEIDVTKCKHLFTFKNKLYKAYKKQGFDMNSEVEEMYQRYEEIGNDKVYLGVGVTAGKKSFNISKVKKHTGFLRDLGGYIWKKRDLALRSLAVNKTKNTIQGENIVMCSPRKLNLYLSIYEDYLQEHKRYKNLTEEDRNSMIQMSTEVLSALIRDERTKEE